MDTRSTGPEFSGDAPNGTFAREIDDRTDRSEPSAAPYSPRTQLFETTFLSLYVTKTATPWY